MEQELEWARSVLTTTPTYRRSLAGEMVNEWAGHDLNHTVQAERAIMQPFVRGCGPWQKYFSDHLVRADS